MTVCAIKLFSLRCYDIQIEDTITVSSSTKRYPLKNTYAISYPMNEAGEDIKNLITQQLKFKLRFQTRRKEKKRRAEPRLDWNRD